MKHYTFEARFRELYEKSVRLYAEGKRGAGSYFTAAEKRWLAANGLTAQHLYDYAEDEHGYGEPGHDRALAIEHIRRDYFLNVQRGRASRRTLDPDRLPEKSAAVRGIEWLPRLLPKARAKLRGELPPSLMYCCGGDRAFFRRHDINPAEFLRLVWRHEGNDRAIVSWVARRSGRK
jgi:hypothetical protein